MENKKIKILDKLFDITGTDDGTYKGFVIFYVGDDGNPKVETRAENNATMLLLRSWIKDHEKLIKREEGDELE